ncbi:ComEA family DNA-binding protein [Pseudarthrobacter sp. J1738]|uniref:ComEA family DNA-binding protein n=1 Tax=Pseudarthrobacter sp. J1738 TaxID=3420446 RepID=UPI003D2C74D2
MSPPGASTARRTRARGRVHRLDALLGPPPGVESLLEPVEARPPLSPPEQGQHADLLTAPTAQGLRSSLLSRFRWRTGHSGVLLLAGVIAGITVLLLLWVMWPHAAASVPLDDDAARPAETVVSPTSTSSSLRGAAPTAAATAEGNDGADLVIYVSGAVARPGVVRLAQGSRIYQALAAAGGAKASADLGSINLAAPLEDGQHVQIGLQGEGSSEVSSSVKDAVPSTAGKDTGGTGDSSSGTSSSGSGSSGSGTPSGKGETVNLNTASAEELGTLPRVGPVLAQRIVQWRTEHGKFSSPEELDAVDGVGPKMLETLLPLVSV